MTKALVSNDTTGKADGADSAPVITYEDLKHFRGLSAELKALQELRQWIYYPVQSPNGREQIGARSEGSTSDPTASAYKKLEKIDERIAARAEEVADLLDKICAWLDTINDPMVKAMINWHYLQGLTWGRVCVKVYGFHDKHLCRKMVMRYLKLEQ